MNKIFNLFISLLLLTALTGRAQTTTISTASTFSNNNGSGTTTFNFQNTNPYPIIITDVSGVTGTSGACVAEIWYKTTPISGAPGAISTANGWIQSQTGTFTGVANTTTTTLQPFLSNGSLLVPAYTTYGMAVFATGQRYSTITGTPVVSAGGCNILSGTNISYGGGTPPTAPTNSPRGWIGSLTFNAIPQVPDNAGVHTLIQPGLYCAGNQDIKVLVENAGTNIINGVQVGWSLNGAPQTPVNYTTPIDIFGSTNGNTAEVTLATNMLLGSGPQHIVAWTYLPNNTTDTVTGNDTLDITIQASLSGTYTINAALPTTGTNFQNFTDFADALDTRGVCGPVIANVASGSGPYNEYFSLNNIAGTSPVNTIRVNGNGTTIQYDNTATDRQLLVLNGSKYVTIDSLKFKSLGTTYGWGALITNGATRDSITRCTFDLSSVTSISSTNVNGITLSGSNTSAVTAGVNGTHCYIANNLIMGATGTGGMYYSIAIASGGNDSNIVRNNEISNFYYYGTYISTATGTIVEGNNYHKTTKTGSLTTFYGIYLTGDTYGTKIMSNRIHDPWATTGTGTVYGIYNSGAGSSSDPLLIANNIIYNINQSGLIYGIYNTAAPHTNVYHNTVTLDQALTSTSANYGLYFTGTNTGSNAKNNNVNITGGTTGSKYGFYYASAASIADAQKNNFYINSTQAGTQYYGYYTAAYASQATFQAAYPTLEVGSPVVDPQFASAATGDLTPGNIALYGSGENLLAVVPRDIVNVPRSLTPTPGAFELTSTATNEAGVVSLVSPSGTFCTGLQPVKVKITNGGINIINTIQVQWTLNNVAQPTVTYNTPINTLSSPQGNVADVLLGNVNFTAAPTVIKAWTHLPNGIADTINVNDTLEVTVAASLSGSVTVNSALPTGGTNYQSFTDLADALNTYGVCGPLVANVTAGSGPYNEFVKFNDIPGTSTINTIHIKGNGAIVQFSNTANDRQLLTLNGTKYLSIDSLTFKALATNYGWGALITNGARYDSITNCTFDNSAVTSISSAQNAGITFSGSETAATTSGDNGSFCYIEGNRLLGATGTGGMYYAISIATGGNHNNIVRNNVIENFYYYGIYLSGAENTLVESNDIHKTNKTASLTTFYGIYATGVSPGLQLVKNRIHNPVGASASSTSTFYGIGAYGDGSATNPVLIANNAIYNINQGGIVYGIYMSAATENQVYHNTINIDQVLGSSSANYGIYATGTNANAKFKNNNISITAGGTGIKYGMYYSTASSFTDAQRNNCYVNSSQSGTQYYAYVSIPYATIADFHAALPTMEVGSLSVDPLFTNAATGNLKPLNFSLFGNGEGLGNMVPTDILNVTRSGVPTPGAFELPPTGTNNAGSVNVISPKGSFCEGDQPVVATILNAGTNNINQLEVHWELNGVAQPTYIYTDTLTTILNPGQFLDTVQLGTANFTAGSPSTIKVWTSLPNNSPDNNSSNDTVQVTVEPSLFTIDAASDTLCPSGSTVIALTPSQGYFAGQLNWQSSDDGIAWTDIMNSAVVNYNTGVLPDHKFFRVKIGGGVNNCYSDTVKILVVDPQITSAEDVSICGGGPATLTAVASDNSIVKWYDNITATIPVATGTSFTTPYLGDTAIYYVSADIGSAPSICASTRIPVTVFILPEPQVDLGPDISQCIDSGAVLILDAGVLPNNVTYLWDDGSTSQVRQAGETGIYSVIVTNEYQCVGGDTISVNLLPNPQVDLGNDTTVCVGVSLVLNPGISGATSYYWSTGQITETITVTSANSYFVVVANDFGCVKSDTINVAMQGALPSVDGVSVTNNGSYTFQYTPINPENVIGYEWNFGDGSPVNYAATPVHTYPNNGVYIVTLKLTSSCGWVLDTLSSQIVGINQIDVDKDDLLIFPNPSSGMVTIKNKADFNMKQIDMYNMVGQLIYSDPADNSKQHKLDLAGIASGIYTIRITTDKGIVTRKLEVLR
jgi:parallel beta-helix repeat protein